MSRVFIYVNKQALLLCCLSATVGIPVRPLFAADSNAASADTIAPEKGLHLYADLLRGPPGGIVLLVINNDRTASKLLSFTMEAERYILTPKTLTDGVVQLNGNDLNLGSNDVLPELKGIPSKPGQHDISSNARRAQCSS